MLPMCIQNHQSVSKDQEAGLRSRVRNKQRAMCDPRSSDTQWVAMF